MEKDEPTRLVSTNWLAKHSQDPDLRILDASWYLPGENRNPLEEYSRSHIPGARFFDIDEIADKDTHLPHMVPSQELFAIRVRKMGIDNGHQIVVYDTAGIFSSPRVWWLFKLMGHKDIAVLDGGFPKWLEEGREVEDVPPQVNERHYYSRKQAQLVKSLAEVQKASCEGSPQILDARPKTRFMGLLPEPRPGLRSGNIPNSINLPYTNLLNENGTMKEKQDLLEEFKSSGLDLDKPVITSCGSGITASILFLALDMIGHRNISLYDGSWVEWGST
ncbi:MAG: 3-mercaptopyruvate sulfurtransferase [Rhodobacteraceae bacterium]|nr:3-mercaptopyruvate sulfurtransferase [Paracoccaceae bacterium]MYG43149.1 3-mercaptopyruvate sulfurtransferase [Paracoccaceae bacterium]